MNHVRNRMSSMMNICINFDTIVHYPVVTDDYLTTMLINYYRDFLETINLDNIDEVSLMYQYDQALFCYLENYDFYKEVHKYYETDHTTNNFIIANIIELYRKYIPKKKNTSWI